MVSVSTNFGDFRMPVEGAMKLLRAWFSNFQCIFHLTRVNHCNCARNNYRGIMICILYVGKYFEEFSNFVEGVVNLWWRELGHGPLLAVAETVHSILSSGGHNFTVLSILPSKGLHYGLNATIILYLCSNIHS
jgi:hypothetical protein